MPALDWSALNTALTLGIAGYLWRQATKVDAIYQALFGVEGKNGFRGRIEKLEVESGTVDKRIEETRHLLRNEIQRETFQLHEEFDKRIERIEKP